MKNNKFEKAFVPCVHSSLCIDFREASIVELFFLYHFIENLHIVHDPYGTYVSIEGKHRGGAMKELVERVNRSSEELWSKTSGQMMRHLLHNGWHGIS